MLWSACDVTTCLTADWRMLHPERVIYKLLPIMSAPITSIPVISTFKMNNKRAFCSIRGRTDLLNQSSEPHGVAMLQVATSPTFSKSVQKPLSFSLSLACHIMYYSQVLPFFMTAHRNVYVTEEGYQMSAISYLSNLPILSCLVPSRMRTIHSSVRRLDYVGDYP